MKQNERISQTPPYVAGDVFPSMTLLAEVGDDSFFKEDYIDCFEWIQRVQSSCDLHK